jgi:hypothetical protein
VPLPDFHLSPVPRRIAVASALLLAAWSLSEASAPTAPRPSEFTGELPTRYARFSGESSVLSVTGESPCGWNPEAGDELSDNRWWTEATSEIFALTLDPL